MHGLKIKMGERIRKKGLIVKEIMKKRNLLLIFGCLFLIASPGKAQVTIGADRAPVEGALLQVKTNEVTNDGQNATKGVAFPRVALTAKSSLLPMISGGGSAAQKLTHTGLVVFNTTEAAATDDSTFKFEKGLYVWKGAQWIAVGSIPEFANALRLDNTDNKIKLGGELTDATTTIDLNDKVLVFDMDASGSPSDNDNLGLFYKNLKTNTTGANRLVVDYVTGKLQIAANVASAPICFFQSGNENFVGSVGSDPGLVVAGTTNDDAVNANNTYIIPFDPVADLAKNELMQYNTTTNTFTVDPNHFQGGLTTVSVEVSGYIGYIANADATGNGATSNPTGTAPAATAENYKTLVNAAIQVKKASESTFKNLTSMRGVYTYPQTPYRQTLSIPPAVVELEEGDEIRLVVIPQPKGGTVASPISLGAAHNRPKIVAPYGTSIAKSIKIIQQ